MTPTTSIAREGIPMIRTGDLQAVKRNRSLLLLLVFLSLLLSLCQSVSLSPVDSEELLQENQNRLYQAIRQDDVELVLKLLEPEADGVSLMNLQNKKMGDQTPVMNAILLGKEQVAIALLQRGADLTVPEKQGYLPIDGASFQGRAKLAKILIEQYGMDPKYYHQDGYTPFHRACWGNEKRHTDTVRVFLEHGVPPKILTKDGKEPLDIAKNEATRTLIMKEMKKQHKPRFQEL